MQLTFLLPLLFASALTYGQISLDRQVIGSAGQSASTSSLLVDYTVGETMVTTASAGTIILTQGFHQPTDNLVSITPKEWDLSLQAYPNPTTHSVLLDFKVADPQELTLSVYHSNGQLVRPAEKLTLHDRLQHTLDFSRLSSGTYFIHLQDMHTAKNLSLTVQKIK